MGTAAPIQCLSAHTRPVSLSSESGERRWLKDILVAETLVNAAQGWTLELSPAKLETYAAAFGKMKANGVTVPVTLDHSRSATAVVGYVDDLFVRGDRLYASLTTNGEHADLPMIVRTVSVEIEDFTDGRGTRYGEAVTAVSIVKRPVVPNQHDFIPLGHSPDRVLYLSIAGPTGGKVASMPDHYDEKKKAAMENETDDKKEASQEPEKVQGPDDAAPVQASAEAMAPLATVAGALGLEIPPGASLDEVLSTIVATINAIQDAAKPSESSPTAEVLALSLDAASARLTQLEGTELVFDKAAIKRLTETLAGTEAKPNAKMLSLGGDNKSPARKVAELLLSLAKPAQPTATPISRMNFGLDPAPNGQSAPIGSLESMKETAKGRNLNERQRRALGLTN